MYHFVKRFVALGLVAVVLLALFASNGVNTTSLRAGATPQILVNEFYRAGNLEATDEWIELLLIEDLTAAELNGFFVGDSTGTPNNKFGAYQFTNMNDIAANFPKGTLIVIGGTTGVTQNTSYDPVNGDWNIFLNTTGTGSYLTKQGSNTGDLAGTDVVWVDTVATGQTISAEGFAVAYGNIGATVLGNNADVIISVPANNSAAALTSDLAGATTPSNWTVSIPLANATPGFPNSKNNRLYINSLRGISEADVSVSIEISNDPIQINATETYTFTVTSEGAEDAVNTVLNVSFSGTSFNGYSNLTGTGCSVVDASSFTCSAGTLVIDDTFVATVDILPVDVGNITASATVSADAPEFTDNNADELTTSVNPDPALICATTPPDFIEDVTGSSGSVTVQGVVIAAYEADGISRPNGFFLQDSYGTDPTLSDGIFVFTGSNPANILNVSVGDHVRITGTAGTFGGKRQIGGSLTMLDCGTLPLPAPVAVTLPFDTTTYADRYVGMLVTLPQTLTVTNNFGLGQFGEFDVSSGGRLIQPTQIHAPGASALAQEELNARNRLVIDDDVNVQNYDPIIYPAPELTADNTLRTGSTVANITGVMDFAFSNYRIRPVLSVYPPSTWNFTFAPRPEVVPVVGGDISVAAFNVLNYFTTFGNNCGPNGTAECRGAANPSELARQEIKIVDAICRIDASIVGLMEIENPRLTDMVDVPVSTLVNALNSYPGCGTYAYVNTGTIGTDAIKNALIYQPALVSPVGSYALLNTSVDPNFNDTRNRPVLAMTFAVTDPANPSYAHQVTVAVNHLKSKGSGCGAGDDDTLQGNCNLTRTQAAQAIVNWLATNPTNALDPYALVIGDLNSYAKEDPIVALENGGYVDLARYFNPNNYSYSFQGRWGTLDYAMGSASVLPYVTGAAEWHINADEPRTLEYATTFFTTPEQPVKMFNPDAFRSSDHDPVIVGLEFDPFIPASPFVLLRPADGTQARTPSQITELVWAESANATSYRVSLFQLSTNVRVGTVFSAEVDASITCDIDGICTYTIPAFTLGDNGTYAWSVEALNRISTLEASNGAFLFTVNTGDLELVFNGGFEIDLNNDKLPDGWNAKTLSGDKLKCDNLDKNKFFANSGNCALMFKGNVGEQARFVQKPDVNGLLTGDTLNLSAYIQTNLLTAGKMVVVKIKYTDDSKDSLEIDLQAPSADYAQFTDSLTLTGEPAVIKVILRNRSTSGKVFVDDVSLSVASQFVVPDTAGDPLPLIDVPATETGGDDLLPLPELPDGFKR